MEKNKPKNPKQVTTKSRERNKMENFESRNFRRQQEKIRLRLIFVTWCRWSELYITLLQNDAIETHTQGPDRLLPSLSTPDWNMEKSGAIRWTLWETWRNVMLAKLKSNPFLWTSHQTITKPRNACL